jgi:hypothetical protein
MKIKVSEATRVQLNWMVAKCEKFIKNEAWFDHRVGRHFIRVVKKHSFEDHVYWEPSTDWSQGGPIIERELITVQPVVNPTGWMARTQKCDSVWEGPTPLVAAMRCYVASKLGDEVEVPEELQ